MHLIKILIRAAVTQKSRARAWKMKSPCSSRVKKWCGRFGSLRINSCWGARLGKGRALSHAAATAASMTGGVTLCERVCVCVSAPEINHPFFRHYYASRVALSLFRRLSVLARYFIEVKRMMVFTPPKAAIHQTAERCHARYHPSTAPRQYIFHGAF
jgi:hypothetical protein